MPEIPLRVWMTSLVISKQAKEAAQQLDTEGAGPSAQPPTAESPLTPGLKGPGVLRPSCVDKGGAEASTAAILSHGSESSPSTPVVSPLVPAMIAAAAAARPRDLQTPNVIRPVIMRPVVATASTAMAQAKIVRPMTYKQVLRGGIAATGLTTSVSASAAPEPEMLSALAAVQRARRMAGEATKKKRDSVEIECIICFGRLTSPVRLQPCGHVQMCSECCQELRAIAESKGVEFEASEGLVITNHFALSKS